MKKMYSSPYLIAEIGGNHEGDYAKAVELTYLAAESGAHGVKFQIYSGETIVNKKEDPARVKHFDKFALTNDQYLSLVDVCKRLGVDFLASIWSDAMIDQFVPHMPFVKVGSGDLTAFPLLKKIAKFKRPILLSTGLANLLEVHQAVEFVRSLDPFYRENGNIGLLQCTSMYPIPNEEANLQVISLFKKIYPEVLVGYSDHTIGTLAAEVACCMGIDVLEFHFTDIKENRTFRDHQVSFDGADLRSLVKKIHQINILTGEGKKEPTKSEIDSGHIYSFRRALYYAKDLCAGATVSEQDLVALRPAHGLSAQAASEVIGRKLKIGVKSLDRISINDFI